jgi:hypothetical protein
MRRNVARLPRRPIAETANGWHAAFASAKVAVKRPARVARTVFANALPLTVVRTVTRSPRAKPRPATATGLSSRSVTTGRRLDSLAGVAPADTATASTAKTAVTDPNIENLTIAVIGVRVPRFRRLERVDRHDKPSCRSERRVVPMNPRGKGERLCRRDDFGA